MTPTPDRGLFGWNNSARVLLILMAMIAGSVLAGASIGSRSRDLGSPELSVDANSAPPGVLSALPGLGPVLSGRIIEAREARPFRSMDDFDRRVYGIGPAKVAALRPFLRFDPPLTPFP